MCGINIAVQCTSDGPSVIQQMMHATAHRGPDASASCEVTDKVFFAGNRLKILDLSDASNMPFWSQEKDAVLVWNGALYNYRYLRNTLLDLGYSFQTNSDTEVLLNWLKEFGTTKVFSLKGMFAFAFADLKTRQLIFARDPSGEKPLYYSQNGNSWFFSSETNGILAGDKSSHPVDVKQFVPYCFYRFPFPDSSFYREIRQVLPGSGMVLNFQGEKIKDIHFGQLPAIQKKADQKSFEEILKDAVLKTFHAERPVGMVLSGGADSSLLYALWYEETGTSLPTFTVGFDTQLQHRYSDPVFAGKLLKKYPSFHQQVNITLESLMENWDAYIKTVDQPIGDSAGFLTWMIAKQAKPSVSVLISGAGADELFGGYNRHIAYKKYLQHPKVFYFLKKINKILPFPSAVNKLLQSIDPNFERTFIHMAAVHPIPDNYLHEFELLYPPSDHYFTAALEWDRRFYLANDILKIHDNACMAHGIEGRSTYLEQGLIELSRGLSEKEHLEQAGKKWIKTALDNRGLSFISNRRKLGFGLPLKEWMDNKEFQDWIGGPIKSMEEERGEYFPVSIRKLISNPERVRKEQFLLLWNLFILASWLKNK